MIIAVKGVGTNIEEFEATITYTPRQRRALLLQDLERQTIYAAFAECAEADGVEPELCTCDRNRNRSRQDIYIPPRELKKYPQFFDKNSTLHSHIVWQQVKDSNESNKLIPVNIGIIERNVSQKKNNMVYEAVNTSNRTVTFNFNISLEYCDVSGEENQRVTLAPGEIRFLAVVVAWEGRKMCKSSYLFSF